MKITILNWAGAFGSMGGATATDSWYDFQTSWILNCPLN